jgi:glycerol-3-phosphate dehydrogenase (NAD(P)+)
MSKLSIIGAGAWGSALSIALAKNFNKIYLHTRNKKNIGKTNIKHPALAVNYPDNIEITDDLALIKKSQSVLITVPSNGFSKTLKTIKPFLLPSHLIAWGTKGFDNELKCFLNQSFKKILPNIHGCVISGPNFAYEVANNKPTAIIAATKNEKTSNYWLNALKTDTLRVYASDDIIGVEIGGAVKNILAIAAGISYGLGYGANTQAAIITRGLVEMTRFGESLGGKKQTFNGLSGLGDLVLTCSDNLSRNRSFGKNIVNNLDIKQVLQEMNTTIEGLNALELTLKMAKNNNIKMPICEQVYKVINKEITPKIAVNNLMSRAQIKE